MHLTPWLVFFIVYFVMGLYYCYDVRDFGTLNFLTRGMFGRVPVAGVFAILYWLAQEEPATMSEVPPEQEPVPTVQIEW